jgi:hypothetical protein
MQSTEEHQKIPKEDKAVMPVRELRKQRMACNLTVERHQKREERTGGYRESRRKLAGTCRKLFRSAKVAW